MLKRKDPHFAKKRKNIDKVQIKFDTNNNPYLSFYDGYVYEKRIREIINEKNLKIDMININQKEIDFKKNVPEFFAKNESEEELSIDENNNVKRKKMILKNDQPRASYNILKSALDDNDNSFEVVNELKNKDKLKASLRSSRISVLSSASGSYNSNKANRLILTNNLPFETKSLNSLSNQKQSTILESVIKKNNSYDKEEKNFNSNKYKDRNIEKIYSKNEKRTLFSTSIEINHKKLNTNSKSNKRMNKKDEIQHLILHKLKSSKLSNNNNRSNSTNVKLLTNYKENKLRKFNRTTNENSLNILNSQSNKKRNSSIEITADKNKNENSGKNSYLNYKKINFDSKSEKEKIIEKHSKLVDKNILYKMKKRQYKMPIYLNLKSISKLNSSPLNLNYEQEDNVVINEDIEYDKYISNIKISQIKGLGKEEIKKILANSPDFKNMNLRVNKIREIRQIVKHNKFKRENEGKDLTNKKDKSIMKSYTNVFHNKQEFNAENIKNYYDKSFSKREEIIYKSFPKKVILNNLSSNKIPLTINLTNKL